MFYNTQKEQVYVCECVVCVSTHAHTRMNTHILLIIVNRRDTGKKNTKSQNNQRVGKIKGCSPCLPQVKQA